MGNGKNIDPEHAKLIYATYLQNQEAAKVLCQQLGYQKTSFYKIVNLQGQISKPPKAGFTKWSEQQINEVISFIENVNPQATLYEIHDEFVGKRNFPEISICTLWRYLYNELITLKKVSPHNQKRNDPQIKIQRQQYANWFLQNQHRTFIFIDECGFNLNTIRTQARAKKGKRAIVKVAQNQGTNKSVIMAVNKDIGTVYFDEKTGSLNSEDFTIFVSSLLDVINTFNMPNVTLVFDNCKIHVEDEIDRICSYAGWEYCFLPPYSPMLNIIEEAFSTLKAAIKNLMAGVLYQERIQIANLPFGEKTRAREGILNRALYASVQEITQPKVMSYWQHMMSFIPDILALNDV